MKKILLVLFTVILWLPLAARGQSACAPTTGCPCQTAAGTSFGGGWTEVQCRGKTADTGQFSSESVVMPLSVVAGDWLVNMTEQCPWSWVGNGCPGGSGGPGVP